MAYPTIPAPDPFSDVAVIMQSTRSFRAKKLMKNPPVCEGGDLNRRCSDFSDRRSVSRSNSPRRTDLLMVTVMSG